MNVFNQLSIWLSFQLSIIFLIGIPITLFFWSIKKRNKAINKLLSIYWKISLLFFISLLLLIGNYNYALLITNISTILRCIKFTTMTIVREKVTLLCLIIMYVKRKCFVRSQSTFSLAIFSTFNNFLYWNSYYIIIMVN